MRNHSVPFNLIPEALQNIAAQCLADVIRSNGVSGEDQEAAKAIGKAFIALHLSAVEEFAKEEAVASDPSTIQECFDKPLETYRVRKCHTGSR